MMLVSVLIFSLFHSHGVSSFSQEYDDIPACEIAGKHHADKFQNTVPLSNGWGVYVGTAWSCSPKRTPIFEPMKKD